MCFECQTREGRHQTADFLIRLFNDRTIVNPNHLCFFFSAGGTDETTCSALTDGLVPPAGTLSSFALELGPGVALMGVVAVLWEVTATVVLGRSGSSEDGVVMLVGCEVSPSLTLSIGEVAPAELGVCCSNTGKQPGCSWFIARSIGEPDAAAGAVSAAWCLVDCCGDSSAAAAYSGASVSSPLVDFAALLSSFALFSKSVELLAFGC